MEVLCKSDYQDIYRVTDGVLLVINKFKYISFDDDPHPNVCSDRKRIWKKYHMGCQDCLKELVVDYKSKYHNWSLSKGAVLYYDRPVIHADKKDWVYQIKTTGDSFSGDRDVLLDYICEIKQIIAAHS